MALTAMRNFGIPCRLVSAQEIAHGRLFRKTPQILLVPGGCARHKSSALARPGRDAIREWIKNGGTYLGFCGGAGLALAHTSEEMGLSLCPWRRQPYPDRISHLVSGHLQCATPHGSMPLPVWWPGRFEPGNDDVEILATYQSPTTDTWLADTPVLVDEKNLRPIMRQGNFASFHFAFSPGQPLVIRGKYGKGKYLLSYAHLETPESNGANKWLAFLLEQYGATPDKYLTTSWDTANIGSKITSPFQKKHARMLDLFGLGEKLGLFFRRTSWLTGWRHGLPGMTCNHILACLAELSHTAAPQMEPYAEPLFSKFLEKTERYLRNFQSESLASGRHFNDETPYISRLALFGHPMLGGGLAGELLCYLEKAIFEAQTR